MRCTAYCTATAYQFELLAQHLSRQHLITRYHSTICILNPEKDKHIFYFPYGCVVCWGLDEAEEKKVLAELASYENERLSTIETEKFEFTYGENSKIFAGIIYLTDQDPLKKLAISHGLAQAVKLTTFENSIRETIHRAKALPKDLAEKGRIKLSRREISKQIGKLFIERASINLHWDILDTPEFFWEYDVLEPFYKMTSNHLDLMPRVEVLNKRLSIVHELFEMLGDALEHQYSAALEWIIIILIAVELMMGILGRFWS